MNVFQKAIVVTSARANLEFHRLLIGRLEELLGTRTYIHGGAVELDTDSLRWIYNRLIGRPTGHSNGSHDWTEKNLNLIQQRGIDHWMSHTNGPCGYLNFNNPDLIFRKPN